MFVLGTQDLHEKSTTQRVLRPQESWAIRFQFGVFISLVHQSTAERVQVRFLSLSPWSGSWQSPHGGTATQRPGSPLLLSVGTPDQQLLGAGRYKSGSRSDMGSFVLMAQALSPAGERGREQDSQHCISPWHQPSTGVGFVATNAASKRVTYSSCRR